jgi:NitT/TauT family transport system ATP-binding protein
MKRLRIGYVPLTDAAILIAAAECGFAQAQNLVIDPVREVSWANIRDRLILGHFDAAHMLAPFAIATTLGLGHLRVPLVAPFALNLNGNAITISNELFLEMVTRLGHAPEGPGETAHALGEIVRQRRLTGADPLTFGVVFPFSTHAYLLRHWLRLGGIHPDADVHIVVVPPPYMAESLRNGLLHGFCVGSPWNSLAVQAQVGRIVALGVDIARCAPEKVLAIPESFADSDSGVVTALIRTLRAAAVWCEEPGKRAELAALLSQERYLGIDKSIIRDTLEGDLLIASNGLRRADSDFLILGRQSTNRPDPRHAQWLYAEMAGAGQTAFREEKYLAAAAVYRPDLYDAATGEAHRYRGENAVAMKIGSGFEEHNPTAYLATIGR